MGAAARQTQSTQGHSLSTATRPRPTPDGYFGSGCLEGFAIAKVVTPATRREAVAILVEHHEISERRACSVVGADRTSSRYRSCRPDDTDLRERLRTLAGERRRFGYRYLHVLLR